MTDVRVTQFTIEVLRDGTPDARVTQVAIEVLRSVDAVDNAVVASDAIDVAIDDAGALLFTKNASDTLDVAIADSGAVTIPGAGGGRRPVVFVVSS